LRYSLISAYAYAIPGPFIYMTLLTGFSWIGEAGARYITYASAGILVFVLLLIYKFVRKNTLHSVYIGMGRLHVAVMAASFVLYRYTPLSMLHLILILFAVACLLPVRGAKYKREPVKVNYKPIINVLFFILTAAGLTALAFVLSGDGDALWFAFRGVVSSLTSFGGGEVYYAIALETFVETEFIAADFYNERILGLAGAMPGPVIVSILSGVGFAYGSYIGGAAMGWMFGIVGLSMAVTATAFGASLLFTFFEILKDSPRLRRIIRTIMPLVCGVLISVGLQLLARASDVIASVGLAPWAGYGAVVSLFALMLLIHIKCHVNDMLLFLMGGAITVGGLSFLSALL
jgi:chromate transporter